MTTRTGKTMTARQPGGSSWERYTTLRPYHAQPSGTYRAPPQRVHEGSGPAYSSRAERPSAHRNRGGTRPDAAPGSYYALFGIGRNASQEPVERAYRQYVRQVHPDKFFGDLQRQQVAQEQLKAALAAIRVLRDPVQRARYDAALEGLPLASRWDPPTEVTS